MTLSDAELAPLPIEEARTLPAKWYISDGIFAAEQERIFRRTWQFAGTVSQIANPGDFFTIDLFGEPIVIVRDRSGVIQALSSVCSHRGGPVAEGAGNQSVPFFQCRYHAWTFNFDGTVRSAPGLKFLPDEKAKLCLPKVRVEVWRSLIFVNLDNAAPSLTTQMDGVDEVFKADPFSTLNYQFTETFDIKCNWKIFQYNSHECYHCRTIHPNTVCNVFEPESLETLKATDHWLFTRYEKARSASDDAKARDVLSFAADAALPAGERDGFYALHMFPNLMITYTPPGYAILVRMVPQGPDRTLLIRDHYFPDADIAKMESVKAFREAVIAEDIDICEAVQRNMSARLFDRGRFVAKTEWQSYWFEQRVREFMARHPA
jgi:choline monooxygenase